jgi:hypothetical protein
MHDAETEHVTFKGVYARDYVPEGAFFISGNVFYQAGAPETNCIKAFRAYLELNSDVASKVRSISYRMTEDNDDDEIIIANRKNNAKMIINIQNGKYGFEEGDN